MIDKSQMKAYAGGLSGGIGVLAGATVIDYLTTIITWLLSLAQADAPPEVATAISALIVLTAGFFGGKFITYWFPPNQVTAGDYVTQVRDAAETQELK